MRFIDKADNHFLILVRIAALTVQTGDSVVQFFDNFLLHLLGVVGNNRKLIRRVGAGYYAVTGETADKTVQKAHTYGAIVVFHGMRFGIVLAVDEITCDRYYRVNCEHDEKEVELRVFFAQILGNDIRSAGRTVAFEQYAEAQSADKSGNHDGIDGVALNDSVCVDRFILETRHKLRYRLHLLKHEVRKRERHAESRGFAREVLVYAEKREHAQRCVYKQRHISHAEIAEILDHYGDTVYTGRRKIVRHDEKHITERIKTAERKSERIHPQFVFDEFFNCHMVSENYNFG